MNELRITPVHGFAPPRVGGTEVTMRQLYKSRLAADRITSSPAGPVLQTFVEKRRAEGYTRDTLKRIVCASMKLFRWLSHRGLTFETCTDQHVASFFRTSRVTADDRKHEYGVLKMVMDLRPQIEETPTPDRTLIAEFLRYLTRNRGLAQDSLRNRQYYARRFLESLKAQGVDDLGKITPAHVSNFIISETKRCGRRTARGVTCATRSFIRFLALEGHVGVGLGDAVPSVAGWRFDTLPETLSAPDVETVLRALPANPHTAARDRAILVLVARLGLRAGEVAELTIDDVLWEEGVLVLRNGKGRRSARMPLSDELGRALVRYLRHHRPSGHGRTLFLTTRAPISAVNSRNICSIVRRAVTTAGFRPHRRGAHLLRKSLATNMLQHGASLREIGRVLRHHHGDTTMVYAKVDIESLRRVAAPWPGSRL